MSYQIGVDIGGTFTDCVAIDESGHVVIAKTPTTPGNFNEGVFEGLRALGKKMGFSLQDFLPQVNAVVLGTTVATNIMLELKGARVGFLTTRGHKDALLMQRGMGRTAGLPVEKLFAVTTTRKPEPLVHHDMILELDERSDYAGREVVALQSEQVEAAVRNLVGRGCEAIAIAFLWSFKNPQHEEEAKKIVQRVAPQIFVTASHEVSPRMGEYERFSATVINAFIGPKVSQYLVECERQLREMGFGADLLIMQCGGGAVSVRQAQETPLITLDSGPVAGITASHYLARQLNQENVIATDMGGTSFDVGIIANGQTSISDVNVISQFHYTIPRVDIQSIGSGGGSIAWIDPSSRSLRVGPESAGAFPGPACYGRGGTRATVTDANVFLGYIRDGAVFGDSVKVNRTLAEQALSALGDPLELSATEVAQGILTVSNARMADLLHQESISRGYDPRDFVIFSYGGAGPLHASAYAAAMGIKMVIIPAGDTASVWSAAGAAVSDFKEIAEQDMLLTVPFDQTLLNRTLDDLETKTREVIHEQGIPLESITFQNYGKLRYQGQTHEVQVPLTSSRFTSVEDTSTFVQMFEDVYVRLYGSGAKVLGADIELVAVRCEATGHRQTLARASRDMGFGNDSDLRLASRQVYWQELREYVVTDIYDGLRLSVNLELQGPCVIELPDTNIVVHPGQSVVRDEMGNFALRL